MKLYLLRHGIAEDGHAGRSDAERRLTDVGIQQLATSVAGLRRLGLKPELIISSPLVRARQTAEIAAQGLAISAPIQQSVDLVPMAEPERARELLAAHPAARELLLVGHEPHLSSLAMLLCGADDGWLTLKKGGLCRIDIDEPFVRGSLIWLLPPKVLVQLGTPA